MLSIRRAKANLLELDQTLKKLKPETQEKAPSIIDQIYGNPDEIAADVDAINNEVIAPAIAKLSEMDKLRMEQARILWEAGVDIESKVKDENLAREEQRNFQIIMSNDEMEKRITEFLVNKSDEDLLKKDSYYWFDSTYGKLIYLLRHNSFHIGELAKALRDWDCERFKWGRE